MVSTIETLFSGDRNLFRGLAIEPHLDERRLLPHPTIRLNMNRLSCKLGLAEFQSRLLGLVVENCNINKIPLRGSSPAASFGNLIVDVSIRHGRVVVLIDEYDYPVLEAMSNSKLQKEVREILRPFYMQIKATEDNIHFTYVTGISKFSKVGIFSEFNNLTDISFSDRYAEMFGYTFAEVKKYFGKQIYRLAKPLGLSKTEILDRVSEYYDGYSFDGTAKVYNPFTILKFLFYKDFDYYWVQSGRQQFVAQYLYKKNLNWKDLDGIPISKHGAREPGEVGLHSSPQSVLYQAGYLTLRYDSKT